MPNKTKSEESKPELPSSTFWTLGNLLSDLLSLLFLLEHLHTQPSPSLLAPNKFVLGEDLRHWAADAQEYIELFPEDNRQRVLLSLLDGEAKDIAQDVIRPGDTMAANAFFRLRQYLTDDTDRLTAQYKLQKAVQ
ncbi:unnamed protein product [Echinostoma caproni]|uniref:Uncharacterized protein n=1 Tax=Echinostoma caproni TaxID=27848 RepID=A0A183AFK4_9TREM|nr:unnamed protein product [Echinostoma caproni]